MLRKVVSKTYKRITKQLNVNTLSLIKKDSTSFYTYN